MFSVSLPGVDEVGAPIANQEEPHRKRSFRQELHVRVEKYGVDWDDEESR
jgi:hypothetical protein